MKRIKVLQTFKDGTETFYETEERYVTPERAGYFCGLGWAQDVSPMGAGEAPLATGQPRSGDTRLEVQNVKQSTRPNTVGARKNG